MKREKIFFFQRKKENWQVHEKQPLRSPNCASICLRANPRLYNKKRENPLFVIPRSLSRWLHKIVTKQEQCENHFDVKKTSCRTQQIRHMMHIEHNTRSKCFFCFEMSFPLLNKRDAIGRDESRLAPAFWLRGERTGKEGLGSVRWRWR